MIVLWNMTFFGVRARKKNDPESELNKIPDWRLASPAGVEIGLAVKLPVAIPSTHKYIEMDIRQLHVDNNDTCPQYVNVQMQSPQCPL
jgi:hypothetical protein